MIRISKSSLADDQSYTTSPHIPSHRVRLLNPQTQYNPFGNTSPSSDMMNQSEHTSPRSHSYRITPSQNNPSTNISSSDVNAMTGIQEDAEVKKLLTILRGLFLQLLG